MMRAAVALLLLAAACIGCADEAADDDPGGAGFGPDDDDGRGGDDDEGDDDDGPGVSGLFDPTGRGGFFASPFPINLRLTADGTLRIADFPNPRGSVELRRYLALGERDVKGFGANSGVFFPLNGPIDPGTLPADVAASTADDATAYLVGIDPDGPDYGRRYPVEFRFNEGPMVYGPPNLLVMLPIQGVPLEHGRTYAAVVTTAVRDADGRPLAPNPDLQHVLAGDSGRARAEAVFAPLANFLEDADVPRDRIAVATVFTTQRPLDRMTALRDHVYAIDLPGIDPASVRFEQDHGGFSFLSAVVTLPIYQQGTPPYLVSGGAIGFDAAGRPIVDHTIQTRLAISVPKGETPAGGWPFLLFAHGSGGDWTDFIDRGVAGWLAASGIAAASIDAPHHGPRAPGDNPDMWSVYFYNAVNPDAFRDNNVQAAVEQMALLRQLRTLVIPNGVVPDGEVRFSADRVYFMGHSQGSTIGPLLVAVDPYIQAAYFSGAGSSLLWNLLTKTKPFPVVIAAEVFLRLRPTETGELDRFHPALNLMQHMAEMADTVSFNPYLFDRAVPGAPTKHVFQAIGVTDSYVGLPCHGAFSASARLDLIEPLLADDSLDRILLAGGSLLPDSGITGNRRDASGDAITGAVVQYPAPPSGRDGHYVSFEFPSLRRRIRCFFATALADGTPTIVPASDDEGAACAP
jgi:predicted esterase